jgi:hypothetical protein
MTFPDRPYETGRMKHVEENHKENPDPSCAMCRMYNKNLEDPEYSGNDDINESLRKQVDEIKEELQNKGVQLQ